MSSGSAGALSFHAETSLSPYEISSTNFEICPADGGRRTISSSDDAPFSTGVSLPFKSTAVSSAPAGSVKGSLSPWLVARRKVACVLSMPSRASTCSIIAPLTIVVNTLASFCTTTGSDSSNGGELYLKAREAPLRCSG